MHEEATDDAVLNQVVLAIMSAAFLMVVAMATLMCGICNLCRKPSNEEEQKQPILGMEENRQKQGKGYDEAGKRARDKRFSLDQADGKMVAEPVQPDPKKLGKQSSIVSAASAFGLAQEAFGLSEPIPEAEQEFVGMLQFSIKYEFTEETLVIKIFRASDLLAKDFSGTSDPFVKVMLLPNKKHKMETKVKRKKLNPIWNETFLFEGFPYNKLQERVLHLEVLDYDRFSRNDPIGELNIPLAEIDLTLEQSFNRALSPSSKSAGKLGKLLVSLCFAPTAGRVTIVIMKCEGLAAKDITGKSDPYVKLWHIYQEKKLEKKKTIVKYNTLNPVYNVSFMFHVSLNKIRDTSFVISVVDKDRLSRNDTIGGIILGSKASPSETSHWAEMLNKPRSTVARWHVLKDMG